MEALTFLEQADRAALQRVYVLAGEEEFLKRQALRVLRRRVLGEEENALGLVLLAGERATLAAVLEELQTAPIFSPRRLVVVEKAEPFLQRYREPLEKELEHLPAHAVLVLEVQSWPGNTRLARRIPAEATIQCQAPPVYRLPAWCVSWCLEHYGKRLLLPAAQYLVDLAGAEMGVLDQELAKLSIYVGDRKQIEVADIEKLVGQGRVEQVWKIFDAISAGQPAQALTVLDQLLEQGEEPLRILGALSGQLRRAVQVVRLQQQGVPPAAAREQAGVLPFQVRQLEQLLRHLGHRLDQVYDWLLQINSNLRGSSALPPRVLLERFLLRLAQPA